MKYLAILLLAVPAFAQPMKLNGTICRMSRGADRMIIATDKGPRVRVTADDANVTFEGIHYELLDLRPGDQVRIIGNRDGSEIRATSIDSHVRTADALTDSLFPSKTLVGRFGVREAQTEFFMLNLPGKHYVRVDAKAAYGPHGRVYVSTLKPGDLLEIRGEWKDKELLRASSIDVITDRENPTCRDDARQGESKEDTAARESDEAKFLDGAD